jgi:serine/threonine-protein kinase
MQSLRLVNGHWVSDPPDRVPQDCAAGKPGHDIWRVTMEFMQLADGTLKGQESDLIESNGCGRAGTVVTKPIVATRIGDLPAGLPPLRTK